MLAPAQAKGADRASASERRAPTKTATEVAVVARC